MRPGIKYPRPERLLRLSRSRGIERMSQERAGRVRQGADNDQRQIPNIRMMPPLAAAQATYPCWPSSPAIELVLTITPQGNRQEVLTLNALIR